MLRKILIPAIVLVMLSGCATNPVTGKRELSLVSESQELSIGEQQYAPLRQMQGGDYIADKEIVKYVREVGNKLAAVSDRKLPYEFNVVNSSVPNAWALPGGKIAINRGLLTELDSEAELAAVLGHEITHAAARHSAHQMSRGVLLQGAMLATVIGTQGKDYAQLAQLGANLGAQLITQKYGRDAEREADYYGILYMHRAGYDPQGAVELQKTFVKLSEGDRQDWLNGLFASHPPSQERVENNIKTAASFPPGGYVGKEKYHAEMSQLNRSKPAYAAYDEGREALTEGDYSKALQLGQKALNIEPREALFYGLLGDVEAKKGRTAAARRYFDTAIELNPGFFYFPLQRGILNAELGSVAAAEKDLNASLKLLPTSSAYFELGNIAKKAGDSEKAKVFYTKAASDKSVVGKKAFAALVDMDLASDPGKYLKIRSGIDSQGRLKAEISNPTPRDVTGLKVIIQFSDNTGRTKEISRPLGGVLKAGTREVIDLGLRTSQESVKGLRAAIVSARVVK